MRGPVKTLLTIDLRREVSAPLHSQLAAELRLRIQQGELAAGERLPSTRDLAVALRLSRNTVVAAYDTLITEGYLETRERSGIFVGAAARAFRQSALSTQPRTTTQSADRAPFTDFRAPVPFRPSQPDVRLFPAAIWNRQRGRVLRRGSGILNYQSIYSSGLDTLQRAVADYLRDSRGVRCDWREVAITAGSQQALFLLAQLLVQKGDCAYIEDPGYPGARQALQQAGAQVVPVPVDEEGICLPLAERRSVSLIYVTPSRQFPLGYCMSLRRRLQLLQTAVRMGTWIVEDDYDSEFRYSSPPLPSLQNLDEHRRVIYVGSFSKLLFPSLRIGYVVLPPALVESFSRLKHVAEDHGPLIDQATLAGFIESGAFHTHLRRCRRAYAERRECLLDALKEFALPLQLPNVDGGMNVAALLPAGWNGDRLCARLRDEGFDVPSLSRYALENKYSGMLLGFTAFTPSVIRDAVQRMATVVLAEST